MILSFTIEEIEAAVCAASIDLACAVLEAKGIEFPDGADYGTEAAYNAAYAAFQDNIGLERNSIIKHIMGQLERMQHDCALEAKA